MFLHVRWTAWLWFGWQHFLNTLFFTLENKDYAKKYFKTLFYEKLLFIKSEQLYHPDIFDFMHTKKINKKLNL